MIPLVLIVSSLFAALALPWVIEHRLTRLWLAISDVADPARTVIADVQAAVSLEMAGTRGFLISRDPSYERIYVQAHQRRQDSYAQLVALTAQLGGDPHGAALRLGALLETADQPVRQLFDGRIPPHLFIEQLPAQQERFRTALELAVDIDRQLRSRIAEQRKEIRAVERLRVIALLVVASISFGAAISVASLGRQFRRAFDAERQARSDSDAARRYAEEQHSELERVTESRAALIRGFTHDVKNPIGAAAGDLQLLQKEFTGPLNEKQRASVARAARALQTSVTLINDLLTLARAEAMSVTRSVVDVPVLVREVVDEYRAAASAKGLTVTLNTKDLVPAVATDAVRVRQILGNLVSNAIKYTAQGHVALGVRLKQRGGTTRDWIAIDVADTGPGIPDSERESLFGEFHRLRSAEEMAGTGIGLAISKRLAHALNGDISVDSNDGRGSVFTLWLPVEEAS